MSVTDEIKARLDIVSYIQQYVPLKKAGRYYKACCPFHAERTPSFVVNQDKQTWRCYGACAEGGDVFNFAMKMHGWTFPEALEQLGQQAGVEVRKQTPVDRQRSEHMDQLRGVLETAAESFHRRLVEAATSDAQAVLDYVRQKRGLSDETIQRFGIGYAPPGWQNLIEELTALGYEEDLLIDAGLVAQSEQGRVYDRFRNRLMIPIRDERGRVIAFGARAMDPDENAKYLNSPQTPVFDKSKVLFGLDAAKQTIRAQGLAVVVEGYMDVIQAHQAGFTNVIAQMGTALTESQLRMIAPRYATRIVMALDADAAGQSATRRSLETARQALQADYAGRLSVDIRILQMPGAKDPDDLIREAPDTWQALVDGALSIADFVINMETADLPMPPAVREVAIQEREALAERLLPMLLASENDIIQQDNVQKLANRLYIPERQLMALAGRVQQREQSRPRPPQTPPAADATEPPPLDYDVMEPPDFGDDDGYDVRIAAPDAAQPVASKPVQPPPPVARNDASEAYCLRMMLMHPQVYYQINRKLRELANGNEDLREGPLCDLGAGDFEHSDYRVLMQMFQMAIKQQELEVLDFLRQNLDKVFLDQLQVLLAGDDEAIQMRVSGRYGADRQQLWKLHQRTGFQQDIIADAISKALQLRRRRLKTQIDEFAFMQMDEDDVDEDAYAALGRQISLTRQALQRLDVGVKQINQVI